MLIEESVYIYGIRRTLSMMSNWMTTTMMMMMTTMYKVEKTERRKMEQ